MSWIILLGTQVVLFVNLVGRKHWVNKRWRHQPNAAMWRKNPRSPLRLMMTRNMVRQARFSSYIHSPFINLYIKLLKLSSIMLRLYNLEIYSSWSSRNRRRGREWWRGGGGGRRRRGWRDGLWNERKFRRPDSDRYRLPWHQAPSPAALSQGIVFWRRWERTISNDTSRWNSAVSMRFFDININDNSNDVMEGGKQSYMTNSIYDAGTRQTFMSLCIGKMLQTQVSE